MRANTLEALNAPNFELEALNLSDMQVGFLVEFIQSLTDPCVKDRRLSELTVHFRLVTTLRLSRTKNHP
jgi:hypothetical protein